MAGARDTRRHRGSVPQRSSTRDVLAVTAVVLFWLACVLFGGSSRVEVVLVLPLRLVSVASLATLVLLARRADWRRVRAPLLLLGAFAATIAIQLVPLPPALWHALPGRAAFAPALALAGADARWMPVSLTPDRSWNALLALLPALVAITGYAVLGASARRRTLEGFIAGGLLSALVGVLQLAGGEDSSLYWYPVSHTGFPIGFFANRNHQAALLAALLPALRAWSLTRKPPAGQPWAVKVSATAAVLFVLPMILLTGSRAGLALALVGAIGAWLVEPRWASRSGRRARAGWIAPAIGAGVVGLLALMLLLGRATAFQRLVHDDPVLADPRFNFLPEVLSLVRSSFPVGYGFGSFDSVFRSAEPYSQLRQVYVANAHNDLLELAMTGGVPSLLVLAALLGWCAVRLARVSPLHGAASDMRVARAGGVVIVIFLLASLVDYPLRTPLAGALFALACAWLGDASPDHVSRLRSGRRASTAV